MYIFDVKWSAITAGPSPFNNERTELFLLGCERARSGNACKGCFNSKTWYIPEDAKVYSAKYCAYNLIKHMPNKYLTIGGGEPLDVIDELIEMCAILKEHDIHILCYTWRNIFKALDGFYGEDFKNKVFKLISLIDGFIDDEFVLEKRCYKEDAEDGLFNSIGSTNQHVVVQKNNQIVRYQLDTIKEITFLDGKMIVLGDEQTYETCF